jgi:hypothetical protein
MCAEITHKVMRQDTVYELLAECIRKNQHDYQVSGSSTDSYYRVSDFNFSGIFIKRRENNYTKGSIFEGVWDPLGK